MSGSYFVQPQSQTCNTGSNAAVGARMGGDTRPQELPQRLRPRKETGRRPREPKANRKQLLLTRYSPSPVPEPARS
eukprot:scaffold85035_cov64-Phaeocystis_antarctica.AAC.6